MFGRSFKKSCKRPVHLVERSNLNVEFLFGQALKTSEGGVDPVVAGRLLHASSLDHQLGDAGQVQLPRRVEIGPTPAGGRQRPQPLICVSTSTHHHWM